MNKTTAMIYPALAVFPLFAGIKMGTPFADGAVLQRGMKVPIWGKVTPGTAGGQPSATARGNVFVEFAGQKKSSDVGADGTWKLAKVLNFRKRKGGDGKEHDTDFIDGPDIVVSCESIIEPVKVRYMGRPRTMGTLYNEASLPLGPFEAASGQ